MARPRIPPELFGFLLDLERNNRREWFQRCKDRYESELLEPALAFVAGFAPYLARAAPHFVADPRRQGGSLFRIYRDVRFSRDKSPYKTHCGIQFRHERGRHVHAPGYYLHLDPYQSFFAMGMWRPEPPALAKLRAAVAGDPDGWFAAVGGRAFRRSLSLEGESLKRVPRGYPADHPAADDLRRKSFIAYADLTPEQAVAPDLANRLVRLMRAGGPFMAFLCRAQGLAF